MFQNGEIRAISVQGTTLGDAGITIYAPQKDNRAIITAVNINFPAAYIVSLYRHSALTGKKILLYTLSLNAGDIIDDSTGYNLNEGDYLYLKPVVGAVNWSVEGFEYQKNCLNVPTSGRGSLRVIDSNGNFKEIGRPGATGQPGVTGPTGPQGSMGSQGPQGSQGSQSTAGGIGTQGTQGSQGSLGATGVTGPTGPQGTQGSQGSQGSQSTAAGITGATGPQGTQGSQGSIGVTGATGVQGSQGSQGSIGVQGTQGTQGSLGPTGATGPQGSQGTQGSQGSIGPTGPAYGAATTFNATTDWAGPSAPGVYKFTFTHNLNSQNIVPQVWDSTGNLRAETPEWGTVQEDAAGVSSLNDITIFVSDTPDGRFAGRIVINGGGAQGNTGVTGPQGATGNQGTQGTQGSQGSASTTPGPQGTQGSIGLQGTQGTQGSLGPTGATGPQGSQGTQGSQSTAPGVQGTQGTQGTQGSLGPTGPTGAQGTQGSIGPQGSQGSQGSQSTAGVQGTQGTQGTQGSLGPTGATGTQGTQGSIGAQGSQGTQGSASTAPGPQGTQGSIGATGNQGTQGTQGSLGPTGATGVQGTQGSLGPQGSQGTQGSIGPNTMAINSATAPSYTFVLADAGRCVSLGATGVITAHIPLNSDVNFDVGDQIVLRNAAGGSILIDGATGVTINGVSMELNQQWSEVVLTQETATNTWWVASAPKGVTGASGPQGTQGTQGTVGSQGSQGSQGSIGSNFNMAPQVTTMSGVTGAVPDIATTEILDLINIASGMTIYLPSGTPNNGQELTIRVRNASATGYSVTWATGTVAATGYTNRWVNNAPTLPTRTASAPWQFVCFFQYDSNQGLNKWVLLSARRK